MCFASKRALSARTSPRDSNRANPWHTCCGYLLGSAIHQLLSIAVATASCCSSVESCARWLAHSWAVVDGRDMLAVTMGDPSRSFINSCNASRQQYAHSLGTLSIVY